MRKLYKLTDQNMYTYGGFQWTLGQWYETNGEGALCGPGWLHAYSDPALAIFMNPIHADICSPRMFEAEGDGKYLDDNTPPGSRLKCGVTRLCLTKELEVLVPTLEQKVCFAIYCALEVYSHPKFITWANMWLDGTDRTDRSICPAYAGYHPGYAAARAAYAAAAYAIPANASNAAAYAASNAASAAWVNDNYIDFTAIAQLSMQVYS